MIKKANEKTLDDLLIDEMHIALESIDTNWTDSYYLDKFYLNNEFVSTVKKLFDENELTIDEIGKCINVIGFSIRIKENSLVKNKTQIIEMFSKEQINNFNAKEAHKLNAELTLFFNKSNKIYVIK